MVYLTSNLKYLMLLLCLAGSSAWACQPHTPLEEVFCHLKAKGEPLPSLEDFRRNQPRIQALLLKAPARRQGISLPKGAQKKSRPAAPVLTRKKPEPVPVKAKAVAAQKIPKPKPVQPTGLSACQLQAQVIACPQQKFHLATNKANRYLAADALGESNRLELSNYRGDKTNQRALQRHLTDNYQRYIEKMLSIGLGASTMSFSKFYYTHEELQQLNVDFAARFETMFGYLKKDKSSMAIKDSYLQQLPASIKACNRLRSDIVVCDNGEHNWVYLAAAP